MSANEEAFQYAIECLERDDLTGACDALNHFFAGGVSGACALCRHLALYIGNVLTENDMELLEPLPPLLGPVDEMEVATALAAIIAGTNNNDQAGACAVFHALEADVALEVVSLLVYLAAKVIHDRPRS